MSNPIVDLRSDTVTRPTPAMREAIARAEVGDDVLGDDPTVIALQERVAELLGKEAACFVPSGTMANQTAIRAHTEPGDEVICHEDSHIIHYETGSPAALSGVMVRTLRGDLGQFDAADVESAVRPLSSHFARSRLLLVENTQNRGGGSIWAMDRIERVTKAGRDHGLRLHLDGARLWNACAATGLAPAEFARHFDTVSCCFSKGLGAPAGSAVAGDRATITRVHRFRKMFGGTMRQAGILAAGARFALENHRARLTDDHRNARRLGEGLSVIRGVTLAVPTVTNMVFADLAPGLPDGQKAADALRAHGVLCLPTGPRRLRMVTHLDVDGTGIETALAACRDVLAS
ncbi:MAG: threonine aldolase family protein [Phycisphaerales bacterium]